jgi:biopolymer transport protein ExbB
MTSAVAEMTAWQVLLAGGPVMGPVLLCSVGGMALVIERFIFFSKVGEGEAEFFHEVISCVRSHNIKGAVAACDKARSPLAPIFKAGLLNFGQSAADITAAMEDAARVQVQVLGKGLDLLALIARIAPLLGLLGTALGLCGVLHTVQARAAAVNPATFTDIADGLWQSLIVTGAGLFVAISVMVAHQYFLRRLDRALGQMESFAAGLLRVMTEIMDVPFTERGE